MSIESEFLQMRPRLWEIKGDTCIYCGKVATELHHIVPRHMGGDNRLSNIVPLCVDCHLKAHSKCRQAEDLKPRGRKHKEKPPNTDEVCGRYLGLEISRKEALEMLGVGKSTFYRWLDEYKRANHDNRNRLMLFGSTGTQKSILLQAEERRILDAEVDAHEKYLNNPSKANLEAYRKASDAVELMIVKETSK